MLYLVYVGSLGIIFMLFMLVIAPVTGETLSKFWQKLKYLFSFNIREKGILVKWARHLSDVERAHDSS